MWAAGGCVMLIRLLRETQWEKHRPLLGILAANDPAALRLAVPALIAQGSDDPIAAPCRTDRITRSLSAGGALLDYHVYPGKGHFDVIAAAHTQNARWIDARLAEVVCPPHQA